MISYSRGDLAFNYRVAAVLLHGGKVLLHQAIDEDDWALPGGRVEFGESAAEALVRELHEELGVVTTVVRLLWLAEGFFDHAERRYHEIGLYFLATLPPDAPFLSAVDSFFGEEGDQMCYRWHPLATLREMPIYPVFLRKSLGAIPEHTVHIVERDNQEQA